MKYWILLLFLLGFFVRVRHIDGPLRWEERDIVPALRDITIDLHRLYIPPKAGDHTPLAPIVAWPLFVLKPHAAWILRLPPLILGSLLGPLALYALSRVAHLRIAVIAGLLITCNTFLINWSAYFMQEMFFQFFGFSGFILLESGRKKQSLSTLLCASVLFALAFWSHEFAILFIPLSLLYLLVHDTKSRSWLRTRNPWIAALMYGILISPYVVWNFSMKSTFSEHSGMSIAQQHVFSTLLANRGFNVRFLEYFILGGFHDMINHPGKFELNHIDPVVGAVLLGSPISVLLSRRHRSTPEVRLASVVFWAVFGTFIIFDLQFRIYRLSVLLIPACVLTAYFIDSIMKYRSIIPRTCAILFLGYAVLSGAFHVPYAAGAAHRGFRWWRKGPIFDEQPLIDTLIDAQQRRDASLVVMPGVFWDHVPLRAEYESGVRFIGGSRETIYSSTFWMRPYEQDEARRLRAVLSCQEDVQRWWEWFEHRGFEGSIEVSELQFNGILEDTTMACPIFLFELEHPKPPPVQTIIEGVYQSH